MVMARMVSNDGDHEGCSSNDDKAVDDAAKVDGFDYAVGVKKMMMVFVCVRVHV